ncbi:MAG: hypothetical protein QXF41_03645 [Candidatus Micrarchaeaceae archaeon]
MAKAKDVGKKAGKKAKEKARSALQTWKQNKEETNAEIADAKSMSPLQVKLPPPAPPGSSSPRPGPPPKKFKGQGTIKMAVRGASIVARNRLNPKLNPVNPVKRGVGAAVDAINAATLASNAELVRGYEKQRQALARYEANINMIKLKIAMKHAMGQSTKEEEKELGRVIKRKNALKKNLKDMAPAYEQAKTNIEKMRLLNNAVRLITGAGAGFGTAEVTMRILQKGADAYPQASPQARLAMEKAKVVWLLSSKARKRLSLEDAQSAAIQDINAKLSDIINIINAAGGNVGAAQLKDLADYKLQLQNKLITPVEFVARSNLSLKDLVAEIENTAKKNYPSLYLLKSKELKEAKKAAVENYYLMLRHRH